MRLQLNQKFIEICRFNRNSKKYFKGNFGGNEGGFAYYLGNFVLRIGKIYVS